MRNLQVELKKLIEFARKSDNIRALVLQGSVVNHKAPIDIFSDLDPLFYCRDVFEFVNDFEWKNTFGEVISYFHDEWDSHDNKKTYSRLTLYSDGFKIDFGFADISLAKYANDMELYKIYVDKDSAIPKPEVDDDRKFYVKKPTNQEFQDVLRDFFFDSSYVLKTICRDEITFNQYMFGILHKKIVILAEWYIGIKHDFKVNTGVYGRYLKQFLSETEYQSLKETYPSYKTEESKKALFKSFDLVQYFGEYIAGKFDYEYPKKHHDHMYNYCIEWIDTIIR